MTAITESRNKTKIKRKYEQTQNFMSTNAAIQTVHFKPLTQNLLSHKSTVLKIQ